MNILTDDLPTHLEIDGQPVEIYTDYRSCLIAMMAMEDPMLIEWERQGILLDSLYPDVPENVEQAIIQGIQFLRGGADDTDEVRETSRLYAFEHDSGLIFAAFQQTHRINLQKEPDLHWWQFLALFKDLGQDTAFSGLVGLRNRVLSGKATKEETDLAESLGSIFTLPEAHEPDLRTAEEIEHDEELERAIAEGVELDKARSRS